MTEREQPGHVKLAEAIRQMLVNYDERAKPENELPPMLDDERALFDGLRRALADYDAERAKFSKALEEVLTGLLASARGRGP